jgi:cysteine-rich repeat protein
MNKCLVAALSVTALLFVRPAYSANFVVNDAGGGGDAAPGDGVCEHTAAAGDCTVQAAVQESNAWSEHDSIILPAGDFPADPLLEIADSAIVAGAGASATTIFGNGLDTVLYFYLNVDVTLVGVTVTGGHGMNVGGAITMSGGAQLTLIDCVVSGNQTTNVGGGVYVDNGSLLMIGTTVTDNSAGNVGGGVYIGPGSSGRILNSTITANHAGNTSGGIGNEGRLTLNNVTVTDNTCGNTGAGVDNDFDGGPSLLVANSIIANNNIVRFFNSAIVPQDCKGPITTRGYNLLEATTFGCELDGPGLGTDILGQDPQLGPLADNGGPTPTQAIPDTSAAVNAGNPAVPGSGAVDACEGSDQRGIDRPSGLRCDIGAFELARCGNGDVDPEEECDDGSNVDGDGCDSNCTVTRCGNGVTTEGEECDDANTLDGDCCTSTCTLPPIESVDSPLTAKASFDMRRGGKLKFRWSSDDSRSRSVFGDPTLDTDVSMCILDLTGATPTLVASARIAAGSGWTSSATSFSYRGTSAAPGTLARLKLDAGGGLRISAKGKSPKLRPGRLPLITPVAVAVRTSTSNTIFVVGFDGARSNGVEGFAARRR